MEQLDDALWIMVKGLAVVFLVMALIAGGTWLSGRVFIAWDRKDKEKKKALAEQEAAEKARKKAERARLKAEKAAQAAGPAAAVGNADPPRSAESAVVTPPRSAEAAAIEVKPSEDVDGGSDQERDEATAGEKGAA